MTIALNHRSSPQSSVPVEAIEAQLYPRIIPRRIPLSLNHNWVVRQQLDVEKIRSTIDRLRLEEEESLSALLHMATVFGIDTLAPGTTQEHRNVTIRELLTQSDISQSYFGGRLFAETRYGIRNEVIAPRNRRFQRSRQAHTGQLLCEFAKHQFSLDSQLAGNYAVRELLQDAIANFSLDDQEIEWTAIALTLYLSPQSTWTNKNGETFSFEDLAVNLLERKPATRSEACFGIHRLESLAVLLSANGAHKILSASHEDRIRARLSRCVERLVKSQAADGSWVCGGEVLQVADAPSRPIDEGSSGSRSRLVHITGHHVNWILLLPPDMQPPSEVLVRAAQFLSECLSTADADEIQRHYCPYCHAARAILDLSREGSVVSKTNI